MTEGNDSSAPVNFPSPLIAETVSSFATGLRDSRVPEQPRQRRNLSDINQQMPRSQLRGGARDSTVSSRHR